MNRFFILQIQKANTTQAGLCAPIVGVESQAKAEEQATAYAKAQAAYDFGSNRKVSCGIQRGS